MTATEKKLICTGVRGADLRACFNLQFSVCASLLSQHCRVNTVELTVKLRKYFGGLKN